MISPPGRRLIALGLGKVSLAFVGVNGREDREAAMRLMEAHGHDWQVEWLKARGVADWADYYSDLAPGEGSNK